MLTTAIVENLLPAVYIVNDLFTMLTAIHQGIFHMPKTRTIAFRLTEEEYRQIEGAASATGEEANDWCRNLALAESGRGDGLSRNERLLYEELARLRYLVGLGFQMLSAGQLTAEAWEKTRTAADQKGAQIADALLARRK